MLLNQVTGANLERLKRESDIPDREFFKKMLARAMTENPLYAVLVNVMADTAKAQRIKDGVPTPDNIHDLVTDIGMLCLRVLELAMLDGKNRTEKEIFMSDPELNTLELPSLEAEVETRLLMSTLRLTTTKKKDD